MLRQTDERFKVEVPVFHIIESRIEPMIRRLAEKTWIASRTEFHRAHHGAQAEDH
jgi:hypothetical protein